MSSLEENRQNELIIRPANQFDIEYPHNDLLELKEQKKMQKAVTDGGIVIGTKTYINSKSLPALLNTDKKGVQIVLNDAPKDDVKQLENVDYLSTPQTLKEICQRKEQPRSMFEMEKLDYAQNCIEAFSNNTRLNKERIIQSDIANSKRVHLGKKVIKERNASVSEMSGLPLNGKGVVHHKNRVADKPEQALDRDNLVVLTEEEHQEFHSSDFIQNEKGYEEYKKSKMKK